MISNQKKFEYLKKLAEAKKLPHALLVSGVSAHDFVLQVFNRDINKVHPDFLIVEPEDGEIKIAQIRDCIWRLSFKAAAFLKVAVINQAHLMNQQAQSAFLKALEEPKGETVLVLCTEYPEALLSTILSRVQRIRFLPDKQAQATATPTPNLVWAQELAQLEKADVAARFQYAEKIAKAPDLLDILTAWLRYFRGDVIRNKNVLLQLQKTHYLISRTNVNTRLALENLMLEISP